MQLYLHFLQETEHKLAFLELAHLVANADGFVNRKEQGYLRSYMDEMDIPREAVDIPAPRELAAIIGGIKDEQVRNIFFAEMLLLIFADGDYNDDEKQLVQDMKRLLGFSDETYEAFKSWVVRMDKLRIEGMKLILSSHVPSL